MAELKSTISKNQKELEKLQDSSCSIEMSIKELQEKILEIGGVRFRSQKSKVDGIQEQIELVNKNITTMQCNKAVRDRNLTKISKSIEKREQELNEIETEINGIEEKLNELKTSAFDIKDQVKQAKSVHDHVKIISRLFF